MRPGDELAGRYVLKEVVGEGRSGEVWLAHDTVVGQDVAVKPERIEGDRETAVRRLLGEPRALAKFRDHPHVVTLFDVVSVPEGGDGDEGVDGGAGGGKDTYWFVMEYVPGGGLDRQPPMPPERVARIGAELADALAALHEDGVVHCDVKPANIGLSRRGTAKLLDFGAAYRAGGAETITANGPFSFTPDYAAPELARGNFPRPASDVFCLAATLYALVTGSPPRGGRRYSEDDEGDPAEGQADHGDGQDDGRDTERLTYWKAERGVVEMDADAVGPLHPLLTAMLQRDPRRRPDAAEAKRLLAAVARPEAGGRAGGGPGGGPRGRTGGWLRQRRPLLAAGAAVGICAAIAAGIAVLPGDDDGTDGARQTGESRAADDAPGGAQEFPVGDPRTADLCSLTDPAALGRFGEAQVDVDYGNFDRCDVLVHPDEHSRIDVSVYLRKGSPPEAGKPARTIGKIGVMEEPPENGECGLLLLPEREAGDTLLGVRVEVGDGSVTGGTATLCAVADEAARHAAEALNEGPVPRRSPGYPDASLAWADACDLLDAEALDAAGLRDDPEPGVANWSCEWSGSGELEAEAAFFRDQPKSEADGELVRPSGYKAYVVPEGDGEETCTVFLEYREYSNHEAEKAAEMVRLYVSGDRPMDSLCDAAVGLSGAAAERLRAR
ncbi:serine/threonine protein kinase [Streptomyces armeniacus]|uniref:non-specific serine/threonine protein kinase n=1 Tax=Streptomyces armeniacus TaxID=83291 RepID=A0A345XWU2_9ACTN|nr:serine/threonine-protein kinase [Streptomyces armeniacus]AXK36108.1 serine/threonine protein kinase [Streptomyces armeniacus]